MKSCWFIISVLFVINLSQVVSSTTQGDDRHRHRPFLHTFCFASKGNYKAKSIYDTNLNRLLSSLHSPNNGNGFGFYNSSIGQNHNKVFAVGLCRGDVDPEDCGSCLNDVRPLLLQACPFHKDAIGWYQNCMLRFSNRHLLGSLQLTPAFSLLSGENLSSSDMGSFNQKLRILLKTLTSKAGAHGNLGKFATGKASFGAAPNSKKTIYALVQCTPDLSLIDCKRCLLQAFDHDLPRCCYGKDTGRIVKPSCNLRFKPSLFFHSPEATTWTSLVVYASPPLSSHSHEGTKFEVLGIVISIAVVAIADVMVLIMCCYCFLRADTQEEIAEIPPVLENVSFNGTEIRFEAVKLSTGDFALPNKLGEGGFGSVYKGFLNGRDIAVKVLLSIESQHGQGETEFSNEVSILLNLQHQNLVRLLGFSVEGSERLLVYEFFPNKSLDRFIFDPVRRSQLLNWDICEKIIVGIARGLLYLHDNPTLPIVHCDLKPSNILLDGDFDPKIADFGLARLFTNEQDERPNRRLAGTIGYMATEYFTGGDFSFKSDVYSFGVMLLEIVRGVRNTEFHDDQNERGLVVYAWKTWEEQATSNLIDPRLAGSRSDDIMRFIQIALLCVQNNAADRPTMIQVLAMLTSNPATADTLPVPVLQPRLVFATTGLGSGSSEETMSHQSSPSSIFTPSHQSDVLSEDISINGTRVNTEENDDYSILGKLRKVAFSLGTWVSAHMQTFLSFLSGRI